MPIGRAISPRTEKEKSMANGSVMLSFRVLLSAAADGAAHAFFLYPQSQYGPPEARVYLRTKSVVPPASLIV